MKSYSVVRKTGLILGIAALLGFAAAPVQALDKFQDRTGLFFGAGLGGGTAIQVDPEFKPGGAIMLDMQLGGGASHYLTLALDLDVGVQIWDNQNHWLIIPGPEANFFLNKSVFIRAGLGLPISFMNSDEVDETDAAIGFDASAGMGWEFFANASLAVGLAIELDYILLYQGADTLCVGFSMGLRYY